jgi:hypothetical protein
VVAHRCKRECFIVLESEGVYQELRDLCKGEGLRHGSLRDKIGEKLWVVFQISDQDTHDAARDKAITTIKELTGSYTEDEQTIMSGVSAMHSDACDDTLAKRLERLMLQLSMSDSTMRRRVRSVLKRLADDAVATGNKLTTSVDVGYTVEEFHAEVELTGDRITSVKHHRRIGATRDGLTMVHCRYAVPPLSPGQPRDTMFDIQVHGGQLRNPERRCGPAGDVISFGVELPGPIQKGGSYVFNEELACPPGQPMEPHYVAQPHPPYRLFHGKVRFDLKKLPVGVWRVDRVQHRQIDICPPDADLLLPGETGEVEVSFRSVGRDGACGVAWSWEQPE